MTAGKEIGRNNQKSQLPDYQCFFFLANKNGNKKKYDI
jgi:hypothetical protein